MRYINLRFTYLLTYLQKPFVGRAPPRPAGELTALPQAP